MVELYNWDIKRLSSLQLYPLQFSSRVLYWWFVLFCVKFLCTMLFDGWNLKLNLETFLLWFSAVSKGNRSAMPLSRIALQSPAGAARGQVWISSYLKSCPRFFRFTTIVYVCDDMGQMTFFSQADDIRNEANELLRIKDYLYNELSKKTGQPVEKVSLLNAGIFWCYVA